ncbi:MAG: ATP-binding cassette domain-containing protein [Pyrinomonadaceae bacterium]|nr:ATP-binding cassette domain-containing protein [Pyrinomonadaceae bacterium]
MKPIIRVENLSKQYKIGAKQTPYLTLRESITQTALAPFKSFRRNGENGDGGNGEANKFWALRDVNFDVMPGEVVGIIGRNGAGKSTLLKILSRITEPTRGKVELFGRIGSLLEVGTGFHPELSGRENIFLNGAILGMRREEITKKFDEIVAFAEVEKFLDTPVKHYSSGMYVRLAFAVAAHLEPEVLVVDEVLAVGDAEFQKKCLGKMKDVSSQGRTVLFVSHNIKAIQQLCDTCVLLKNGSVDLQGKTSVVAQHYTKTKPTLLDTSSNSKAGITKVRVLDENSEETALINYGETLKIEVTVMVRNLLIEPAVDLAFYSGNTRLFALQSDRIKRPENISQGEWIVSFEIEHSYLVAEQIHFDIGVREKGDQYFLLIEKVLNLMPNYATIPPNVTTDSIMYPKADCSWTTN